LRMERVLNRAEPNQSSQGPLFVRLSQFSASNQQ